MDFDKNIYSRSRVSEQMHPHKVALVVFGHIHYVVFWRRFDSMDKWLIGCRGSDDLSDFETVENIKFVESHSPSKPYFLSFFTLSHKVRENLFYGRVTQPRNRRDKCHVRDGYDACFS